MVWYQSSETYLSLWLLAVPRWKDQIKPSRDVNLRRLYRWKFTCSSSRNGIHIHKIKTQLDNMRWSHKINLIRPHFIFCVCPWSSDKIAIKKREQFQNTCWQIRSSSRLSWLLLCSNQTLREISVIRSRTIWEYCVTHNLASCADALDADLPAFVIREVFSADSRV
jgi:hypothetical protein